MFLLRCIMRSTQKQQKLGAKLGITGSLDRAPVAERPSRSRLAKRWEPPMPGNPKECRMRAARCAEMAADAHTPQLRATFLELSKNWERLAIQLENAFAQLAESNDIGSRIQETVKKARELRNK